MEGGDAPKGGTGKGRTPITQVLAAVADGDERAAEALLPLVYDELKSLAHGRLARLGRGETLQTTDLVHESWMRLSGGAKPTWENRRHFFGAAARAMRNILVEQARRKGTLKRDVSRKRSIDLEREDMTFEAPVEEAMEIAELLEELEAEHARPAQIVSLRFFAGLSMPEVAEIAGVSLATAERDWRFARAWLQQRIGE
jgi:RNA polymerase sigma factor (TIGR02999 family)